MENSELGNSKEAMLEGEGNTGQGEVIDYAAASSQEAGTQTPIVDTPPATIELNDEQVFQYLSTKTEREIKSYDDLIQEKTVEIEKPLEFASEQLKIANDYVRETGRSLDDWNKTQSTDFTTLSSEQLIKMDLKAVNPELTDKEVRLLYEDSYMLDPDISSEREIETANVRLKMDAQRILNKAQELQNKFKQPIENKDALESQAQKVDLDAEIKKFQERQTAKNSENKEAWLKEMQPSIEGIEKVNVGEFEVQLTPEMKTDIINKSSKLESFWKENFISEGKWDYNKLSQIMFLASGDNLNAVVGNIKSNLLAQGSETVIENRKKLNLIPNSKQGGDVDPKLQAELDAFAESMKDASLGR